MFSNRKQQYGERLEDYAADLKRLYDKAHSKRDKETRKYDLLRKFLDGLNDDTARFQIEYFKSPSGIDEAVAMAVEYQEAKRRIACRKKSKVAKVEVIDDSTGMEEEEGEVVRMAKAPGQKDPGHPHRSQKPGSADAGAEVTELKKLVETLVQRLEKLEKPTPGTAQDNQSSERPNGRGQQRPGGNQRPVRPI
jgi:hypothetical protein